MKKISAILLMLMSSVVHAAPTDIIGNENPNETPHARFVMVINGPEGSNTVGFRSAKILNPADSQDWKQIGEKPFYSIEAIRLIERDSGLHVFEAILGDVAVGTVAYFTGALFGFGGALVSYGSAAFTGTAAQEAVATTLVYTGAIAPLVGGVYLGHVVNRLNPVNQYYEEQVISPDAVTPNKKVQLNMSFQYIKKHLEIALAQIP